MNLLLSYIYYLFLLLLVISAVFSIASKNLLCSVIFMSLFNLFMVIIFLLLQAPDVAMAEAVVGMGFTTALFIITISKTKEEEK
jgi:uncharacterized MnhB-related membrane protein